jgi:hypothetical protein
MSNYSDPEAVRPPIALGWCGCPRKDGDPPPHGDTDYVTIVERLGYADIGVTRQIARVKGVEAYHQALILVAVKAWTFVLPDGKPRPIDSDQVGRLDERTVTRLLEDDILGLVFTDIEESPPNGSGAPSVNGSPESASTIPTSPAPEPSTTR